MNKKEYLHILRKKYPGEDDKVLELVRLFGSLDKAQHYIVLLEACTTNADIARKVVLEMYVAGDVDAVEAVKGRFIHLLLPFTCLEKTAKPHSVAYHIRNMLLDEAVRKAHDEAMKARLAAMHCQANELASSGKSAKASSGPRIVIQLPDTPATHSLLQQLLELARNDQVQVLRVDNATGSWESLDFGTSETTFTFSAEAVYRNKLLSLVRTSLSPVHTRHVLAVQPKRKVGTLAAVRKMEESRKGTFVRPYQFIPHKTVKPYELPMTFPQVLMDSVKGKRLKEVFECRGVKFMEIK